MKKYFITKSSKDIYNFHIFTDNVNKDKFKKKNLNKKNDTEISLELLLDNYKNRK